MERVEIKKTKKYSMFNSHNFNRPIREKHKNKLIRAIEEKDLLKEFPLVVCKNGSKNKYEVLDGQHRLAAAKTLKKHVYYIETVIMSPEDISRINTSSRNWTLEDYLLYFAKKDYTHYKQLLQLKSEYDFNLSSMTLICTGKKEPLKSFKEGFLSFSIDDAVKRLKMVSDYEPYFSYYKHGKFVRALVTVFSSKNYNHKHMMERVKNQSYKLLKQADTDEYLRILTGIYNYGLHKDNRVSF
jgi:hypothetical protein